jgi:hypothetical protein
MKRLFSALAAGLLLLLWACERPVNPVESGVLTFSADTLKFDSLFTTFLSPSQRLIVSNFSGEDILISRIWLDRGARSEFSMIADGIQADTAEDIVIPHRDSIHIFINLRSQERDKLVEEFLYFQVGDEIQQVLLRARVIDAYFLQARIVQEEDLLGITPESFYFRQDTTLTPEKPIVLDGPIIIPEGVTVSILPGTTLYFTPYKFGVKDSSGVPTFGFFSYLIVGGTLRAEGQPGQPVEFRGTRFDSLYQENPAQWRGIRFLPSSKDNLLSHCRIKNALIGIEVDSGAVNQNPKVLVQHSEIRNMGVHGIAAIGADPAIGPASPPALLMENSIVSTCKLHTLWVYGGSKLAFYNCTFANFNISRFTRRNPQLRLGNWLSFDGVNATVFPSYTQMVNCIVWGSEEDEIVLDTLPGASHDALEIRRSIVRVSSEYEPFLNPYLPESFKNADPQFNDYFLRDYRIKASSIAINSGISFPSGSTGYSLDFRGRPDSARYDGFDIGAWEYYPLE